MAHYRTAFFGDSSGVRRARKWVSTHLNDIPRADDIGVVVTELTANAMRHTASGGWLFAVTVETEQAGVRIVVEDLGSVSSKPHRTGADQYADHGHGMELVHTLSDGWGVTGDITGRDVWAWFDIWR